MKITFVIFTAALLITVDMPWAQPFPGNEGEEPLRKKPRLNNDEVIGRVELTARNSTYRPSIISMQIRGIVTAETLASLEHGATSHKSAIDKDIAEIWAVYEQNAAIPTIIESMRRSW